MLVDKNTQRQKPKVNLSMWTKGVLPTGNWDKTAREVGEKSGECVLQNPG